MRFYLPVLLFSILAMRANAVFPILEGSADFKQKVAAALTILQKKAPDALDFVNKWTKKIQMFDRSGMCAWCNPPTYQVAPVPANLEPYWLASTICHDSYHSYLYQYYKSAAGGREPQYNLFAGFDAERQCNTYQLSVMQRIGAPQYMIEHMKKQNGTHCDLNGDGVCDDKDYAIRKYK